MGCNPHKLPSHHDHFLAGIVAAWEAARLGQPRQTELLVKLLNGSTGDSIATITGHTAGVSSVSFSPLGHLLASASVDKTVKLWCLSDAGNFCAGSGMAICPRAHYCGQHCIVPSRCPKGTTSEPSSSSSSQCLVRSTCGNVFVEQPPDMRSNNSQLATRVISDESGVAHHIAVSPVNESEVAHLLQPAKNSWNCLENSRN